MTEQAWLVAHPPRTPQFREPRRDAPSGVVAVHTAESPPDVVGPDGGTVAVARFIQGRKDPGSYHWLADSDSRLLVVPMEWEAFHDGTGTNRHSVGISVATRADRWPDLPPAWREGAYGQLALCAREAAAYVLGASGVVVPARRITGAEAHARVPGYVAHADLDPKRRTDPGAHFEWDHWLGMIDSPTDPEDNMDDAEKALLFGILEQVNNRTKAMHEGNWGEKPGYFLGDLSWLDVRLARWGAAIVAAIQGLDVVGAGDVDEAELAARLAPALTASLGPEVARAVFEAGLAGLPT